MIACNTTNVPPRYVSTCFIHCQIGIADVRKMNVVRLRHVGVSKESTKELALFKKT